MKTAEAIDHLKDSQRLFQVLQEDVKGFEKLAVILKQVAGINLPTNTKNISLMAGRLCPVIKDFELSGYNELLGQLNQGNEELKSQFILAMTTNTTSFFREKSHFDTLRAELPKMFERKRKANDYELRVWCAAASYGHEPFTILMTILETVELNNSWDLKFLASDIDTMALQKAVSASYTEQELEGVAPFLRQKYFSGTTVKPIYQKLIRFAPFNLMSEPYPFQHRFDIVFCRNVLIYFEQETAARVLDKMIGVLNLGGLLFIGHSEAGTLRNKKVKSIAHAVYQKV